MVWKFFKVLIVFLLLAGSALIVLVKPWEGMGSSAGKPAKTYLEFQNPQPVKIHGYFDHAMEPFISRDGEFLFFNNLNHSSTDTNLYYATRIDHKNFRFCGEVKGANSKNLDGVASMDNDGQLYFTSNRTYEPEPGKYGSLFMGIFSMGNLSGIKKVPGAIDREEFGWINMDGEISADGKELFVSSAWFRFYISPPRQSRIRLMKYENHEFCPDSDEINILATVNSTGAEYAPCLSTDGKELFFTRAYLPHMGGKPQFWVCRAVRTERGKPFSEAELVGGIYGDEVNPFVEAPSLSGDGKILYYHKRVGEMFQIWCLSRTQ